MGECRKIALSDLDFCRRIYEKYRTGKKKSGSFPFLYFKKSLGGVLSQKITNILIKFGFFRQNSVYSLVPQNYSLPSGKYQGINPHLQIVFLDKGKCTLPFAKKISQRFQHIHFYSFCTKSTAKSFTTSDIIGSQTVTAPSNLNVHSNSLRFNSVFVNSIQKVENLFNETKSTLTKIESQTVTASSNLNVHSNSLRFNSVFVNSVQKVENLFNETKSTLTEIKSQTVTASSNLNVHSNSLRFNSVFVNSVQKVENLFNETKSTLTKIESQTVTASSNLNVHSNSLR
ncbi:MAG: hypothetical protein AB3K77_03605, partial [Methanosarcinaceae archaeon]